MNRVMKWTLLGFLLLSFGCNSKLLVNKKYIVNKKKGIAVFIDKEGLDNRHLGLGDVYTDSLLPDFFIPYDFSNAIVTGDKIENALKTTKNKNATFLYLKGDCMEKERNSYVEESLQINLDEKPDSFLKSKRLFILPVKLEYMKSDIDQSYYAINKNLQIKYKSHSIYLKLQKGYYDVLRVNVLQYNWK